MEGRNQVFQRLKPPCVALSQAALALNGPRGDVLAVTRGLEDLDSILLSITSRPDTLDEKLADYVFFPLSQVLKVSQRVSVRCLELALHCLSLLIEHGWRSKIQPQLAAQVLILCTLLAEKSPKGVVSAESTDELQCNSIWCLLHLFEVAEGSTAAVEVLAAESNMPQLGQTISTILAGISDGGSTEVQIAAVNTLQALIFNIATVDIQAAFLPGIVSVLTKVLTPQTKHRRNHRVLIGALEVLDHLFKKTLSGSATSTISEKSLVTTSAKSGDRTSKGIDEAWLQKAASQLKPAVTHIVKIQAHERSDVRDALSRFCLTVLACTTTLENCAAMCLEALVTMASDDSESGPRTVLVSLVSTSPAMSSALQTLSHDWAQSLPTKMQSADEQAKVRHIQKLSTAYSTLASASIDTSMLDRELSSLLRDSSVIALQSWHRSPSAVDGSNVQSLELTVLSDDQTRTEFGPLLAKHNSGSHAMLAINKFAQVISCASTSATFTAGLARDLRRSHGDTLIATFWLLFDATRTCLKNEKCDELLSFSDEASETNMAVLEDLYTFSLEILSQSTDTVQDYRMQGLALRALALRAQAAGVDFRHELIDALYPVLHAMATPQEELQQDSIVTLNIFTTACGYNSVQEMIVENVDYLTNSVTLKLNAFDVSPQAPQVLLMMVRLAGPSLLPYLEDTIDSIFAALEDFHGYPLLVELLFRVLSVVAEEGSKAPQLAITDDVRKATKGIREEAWRPATVSGLIESVKQWAEQEQEQEQINQQRPHKQLEPHPKQPWKETESTPEAGEADGEDEISDSDHESQAVDTTDPAPPLPKTYNLLLKISDLTQHYLPSASSSLRASLLTLIKTTTPAIARHENSFLPLINTLWPEIVSRLDDPESYIVATSLDIIALLCEYAGDFMRTRITQLWPGLLEIVNKTGREIIDATSTKSSKQSSQALLSNTAQLQRALQRMHKRPADYSDTSTRLLWQAEVKALSAIVKHVPLVPHMFDDALEILSPVLDDQDVRVALDQQNADAVWLALARSGTIPIPPMPTMPEGLQMQFAAVAG